MPKEEEERKTPFPPAPPNPSEIPMRITEFARRLQGGIGTLDEVIKQMDRSFQSPERAKSMGGLEKLVSSLSESDKEKLIKSIKEKTKEKLEE